MSFHPLFQQPVEQVAPILPFLVPPQQIQGGEVGFLLQQDRVLLPVRIPALAAA
jgi:hypothetical protein